jgi:hypothetical protein
MRLPTTWPKAKPKFFVALIRSILVKGGLSYNHFSKLASFGNGYN